MATTTLTFAQSQADLSVKIHELTTLLPKFKSPRDVEFACKIIAYFNRHDTLSAGFTPWLQKMIDRASGVEPVKPAPVTLGNLTGLITLFQTAGQKLKYPEITLQIAGKILVLTVQGQKSATPGYVTINGPKVKGQSWKERPWYGKISPEGRFVNVRAEAVEAESQTEAIEKAEQAINFSQLFPHTVGRYVDGVEYTVDGEDCAGFLVDEVGDEEYDHSKSYQSDGKTTTDAPDAARDALRRIRDARDYHAENGEYPKGTLGMDQEFDDWAADVAQAALTQL